MFAQIEAGQTRAVRIIDATKAALAVLVILLVAALAGARLLQIFGVSLDAFSTAGGGVLTWIGFSMLRGISPQARDPSKDGAAEKRSLTPVILFAASPGTITGVITLAVAHAKLALPVTALAAVAVTVAGGTTRHGLGARLQTMTGSAASSVAMARFVLFSACFMISPEDAVPPLMTGVPIAPSARSSNRTRRFSDIRRQAEIHGITPFHLAIPPRGVIDYTSADIYGPTWRHHQSIRLVRKAIWLVIWRIAQARTNRRPAYPSGSV